MQEVRIEFPCRTIKILLSWANFDQDKKSPSINSISGSLRNLRIALFQIVSAV